MLRDAFELGAGQVVEADVCIVGAGPAGLTLASTLAATGIQTCVLAGGALEADPIAQSLYAVRTTGAPYLDPLENRARRFGGTSHKWAVKLPNGATGVRFAKLDPWDFTTRDWVPNSGWPISADDLEPHYERAHTFCGMGPCRYAASDWDTSETPPLPLPSDEIRTNLFHFADQEVFARPERNRFDQVESVDVWLNAHAVEIVGDRGVKTLRCKTTDGAAFEVVARRYVVAAGGIESARLLLCANDHNGIGTSSVVGRYYMDHPIFSGGHLYPGESGAFSSCALYDLRDVGGTPVMGTLSFTEKAQREHELLNVCISLMPRPNEERLQTLIAFTNFANSIAHGKVNRHSARQLWASRRHPGHLASALYDRLTKNVSLVQGFGKGGWSALGRPERRYERYELLMYAEQTPDVDNRITLGGARDALGMRKAELHWTWGADTVQRLARSRRLVHGALEKAGIGRVDPRRGDDFSNENHPQGIAHHMGATRMSHDPNTGVVDADCRVHGVDNLFVLSSSVFPTGGYANPTLTIVALALRLADHLKIKMHDN